MTGADCQNCGFTTEEYKEIDHRTMNGVEKIILCTVCYTTYLSHATLYPNQCRDPKLFISLAQITNMIISEIRKLKE